MAPIRNMRSNVYGLVVLKPITFMVLALGLFINDAHAKNMPPLSTIQNWVSSIDTNLQSLPHVQPILKMRYMQNDSNQNIKRSYLPINGTELVITMSKSLSEMMLKKMDALWKLVSAAESAAAAYQWNKNLVKESVNYVSSKDSHQNLTLTYVERFKKEVNFNTSSVHIPVEIYDGDIEILNGLNWSAALDEQFAKNYNNDSDILWQYFGSHTGFMRSFPAATWPQTPPVDLYDVRRQSWYTQGSSSPKDMMILIDKSGSTHGQSLQLMKNAVKSILDTLGENDFVNIIAFGEKPEFVSTCFNHTAFVQANFRNKKRLEKDVDLIKASGQADFSKAIQFAFEKFQEFNNATDPSLNIGANCNKVIMLLTDGGTDTAESVFEKYNWPEKSVRVFTYAVGPTPNPVHAIRWMACANRGFFSQIPAMGAIRAKVQAYTKNLTKTMQLSGAQHILWEGTVDPREYIPVLSRPQVIQNKKTFEWGNIYEDYMGLGLMTTVTLPVYNRSLGSSNQTILGVMGIDVTTSKLEAMTPFDKIGPNGYSFAINPNGYVVFHPNLLPTGKSVKEPPNIDMLELEIDEDNPELADLRSKMIDSKTGNQTTKTLFLSPDQRYVTFDTATYWYTDISNTSFRLAITVPKYQTKWQNFSADFKKINLSNINTDHFAVLVAPWNYHKNLTKQKNLSLADVKNLLAKDPNPENWNLNLLYHLAWDESILGDSSIQDFLLKFYNNTNTTDLKEEKNGVFIMTNGGITLVSPKSKAKYFEGDHDPRNSSIYKRAQHYDKCIFMADYIEGPRSNTSAEPDITMACAVVYLEKDNIVDKPAVVGEWISHSVIIDLVKNASKIEPNFLTCSDTTELHCYLVDEGGFLVASNADNALENIGRFFGEVEPAIFMQLDGDLFNKAKQYDFQALCSPETDTASAAFRGFTIPTMSMFFEVLNVGWWTSKVTWAYSSFNFFSWLFSPTIEVLADSDEENKEEECVKQIQQYYIKDESRPESDWKVECFNYTRIFKVFKLSHSNLLFIVAEPVGETERCEDSLIYQKPSRVSEDDEETIVCSMAQNPRKRLRPYQCYHHDPREDDSQCGCVNIKASVMSVMIAVVVVMWQWTTQPRIEILCWLSTC
ncbi:Voltage-dependent calcium channel subunit alpha-2/delta-2 [Biomphalaria glabrata]